MQLPSGSVSAQTSESGEVESIQGDLNFFCDYCDVGFYGYYTVDLGFVKNQ